jgi:hypothetical protein
MGAQERPRRAMRLNVGGTSEIANPTAFQIERALRSLDATADGFAILGLDDQTYIQAAVNSDGSFVLEYQEGSTDSHYAVTGSVALTEVLEALQAYARKEGTWKARFAWERVPL